MTDKHDNPSMKDKLKEGISVEEIETFARKHLSEMFLILAVIIATISSIFDFFTGSSLSILLAGLGAIVSIGIPTNTLKIQKRLFSFLGKQEKSIQIIIGIVRLVIAIFIPFVVFLELGLLSGVAFHSLFRHQMKKEKGMPSIENPETEEKEHI